MLTIESKDLQSYVQEGEAAFRNGEYDLAESILRDAVRGRIGAESQLALAVVMENLALIFTKQSRYLRAERVLKRAITLLNQPSNTVHVCRLMYKLAHLYLLQGKFSLCARAVDVAKEVGQSCREHRNKQMEIEYLLQIADLWNRWGQSDMAVTTYGHVTQLRQLGN